MDVLAISYMRLNSHLDNKQNELRERRMSFAMRSSYTHIFMLTALRIASSKRLLSWLESHAAFCLHEKSHFRVST